MKRITGKRPSAAMVVALLALVMATVGTGYAALKLPKNSVGTKQLKKNSVNSAKLKKNSVNSAKVKNNSLTGADINLGKLGTVPSATTATTATTADALSPLEAVHSVGAAGEPGFEAGATNYGTEGLPFQSVGFYKDHEGVVHLLGTAKAGTGGLVFRLPAGFRPASGVAEAFEAQNPVFVLGSGLNPVADGIVAALGASLGEPVLLSGITFRAGS